MIANDEKNRFIELRARGLSFDKISAELNISKPTLIKWNKEMIKEIDNLKYIEMQSVFDQFKISTKEKLEIFLKKQKEVYSALEKQDIKKLSLKDLLKFKELLEMDIHRETSKIQYSNIESVKDYTFVTSNNDDFDDIDF